MSCIFAQEHGLKPVDEACSSQLQKGLASCTEWEQKQSLFKEASRAAIKQTVLDFVLTCHQAAVQFMSCTKSAKCAS